MNKAPKKASARRRPRTRYTVVAGKRVKATPRMQRIMRALAPLKGLDVPPR